MLLGFRLLGFGGVGFLGLGFRLEGFRVLGLFFGRSHLRFRNRAGLGVDRVTWRFMAGLDNQNRVPLKGFL